MTELTLKTDQEPTPSSSFDNTTKDVKRIIIEFENEIVVFEGADIDNWTYNVGASIAMASAHGYRFFDEHPVNPKHYKK